MATGWELLLRFAKLLIPRLSNKPQTCLTRMHGVPAQTGFPRTLTKTIYISAIFSTLNPILSVANLSRLECAETRAYEYKASKGHI